MPTVKLKLEPRTTLTKGIFDRSRDAAEEFAFVSGLTGGNSLWSEAVDEAVAAAGKWHSSITDLPLMDATALQVSGDQAFVNLRYERNERTVPTWQAFEAPVSVTAFGWSSETQYFDSMTDEPIPMNVWYTPQIYTTLYDHPAFNDWDPDAIIYPTFYWNVVDVPVFRLVFRTVLPFDPSTKISHLYGAVNLTDVTMGGVVRKALTLKFSGINCTAFDSADGMQFITEYQFDWISNVGNWGTRKVLERRVVDERDGYGRATRVHYDVKIVDKSPDNTEEFSGAFPVHDPANPGGFIYGPPPASGGSQERIVSPL